MKNIFTNKHTTFLLTVAGVLFIVTTIVAGYFFIFSQKNIELIDFVGKTRDTAVQWREENHLDKKRMTFISEYNEDIAKNVILKQNLNTKHILQKNEIIELTISNGPDPEKEFEIPSFKDMNMIDIQKWFDEHKFSNVNFSFEDNKNIKKDLFIKITPSEKKLKRSEKISISISSHGEDLSEEIIVPDFSTYSRKNIEAWAKENKISVIFQTETSTKVPEGKFISQLTAAGTKIKKNSKLVIKLSGGKAINILNFIGKKKEEVQAWANKNAIPISFKELYSKEEKGKILAQNITNGTFKKGTKLIFDTSIGLIKIADFTNQPQSKFDNFIKAVNNDYNGSAKIVIKTTEKESDKTTGTILTQSISGEVAPGTIINITVAIGKKVTVTNQKGLSEAKFITYLNSLGMRPGTKSILYSTQEKETIINNKDGVFPAGSPIDYTVSLGQYIPKAELYASGSNYAKLEADIINSTRYASGWVISKNDVKNKDQAIGNIIKCDIKDKKITCDVSSGAPIKMITIPNVIGKSEKEAQQELKNLGLKVTIISDYHSSPEGTIFAQDIPENTEVKPSSSIIISKSKGPKPTPTPTPTPNTEQGDKIHLPTIDLRLYDDPNFEVIKSKTVAAFSDLGFTNISVIEVPTGGDTGKGNKTAFWKSEPEANGALYGKNDPITIWIYKGENH